MKIKLFGNSRSPRLGKKGKKQKKKEKRSVLERIISILLVLVTLESLYCTAVFSNIPFVAKYRTIWIETAMSTMSHHYLATWFFPPAVVKAVTDQVDASREAQIGVNSNWNQGGKEEAPVNDYHTIPVNNVVQDELPEDQQRFFELFDEIDYDSMQAYVKKHPETVAKGWDHISINEAGLDDKGTDIQTLQGDQVLALDVENAILLLRVTGSGYRGVLALAKDASRVSVQVASSLGAYGAYAGDIASEHNGILAMTGSGFIDNGGNGNGGTLAGYAMCNGVEYGKAHMGWSYKRAELHNDNLLYITDAQAEVSSDTRDAVEFMPALIIDGKIIVDDNCGWNAVNPRAVIGQNDKHEIMMLTIEGRQTSPPISVGTGVVECANILARYGCMQAMNLDGGSSAMMWYDGEYVMRCGNNALPYGRPMPNAFVYEAAK